MQNDGVVELWSGALLKTFSKKTFAFSPDTGKNIGVGCIIQCQSVVF